MPIIEKQVLDKVLLMAKDLDMNGDNIATTVNNLKTIAGIKKELEKIVLNPNYIDLVTQFANAFADVSALQNSYFSTLEASFKPDKLLEVLQEVSVQSAIESLTESGIGDNVIAVIKDHLLDAIKGGLTISNAYKGLRELIIGADGADGILTRYSKQITTDSLNQYSRSYTSLITDTLSLNWFMYVGAIIKTSRPFCKALVEQKYFHRSQIPELLKGHLNDKTVALNDNTGLPYGMMDNEDVNNFLIYAGGWQCNHACIPVSPIIVPKELVMEYGK
jgi:hypothetical protein